MGSSILSEVDDTSILRTGLPTCYWRPLNWLPASRLLRPRSGLERSDFVPWPQADMPRCRFGHGTRLGPTRIANQGHSGFIPAALTTLPHFSVSSTMNLPKAAGVPANTVAANSAYLALI